MPEEHRNVLREFIDMMSTFRGGEEEDGTGRPTDKTSMETRALALVLSGAIPPTIDLEDCNSSAILVLASDAGLFFKRH